MEKQKLFEVSCLDWPFHLKVLLLGALFETFVGRMPF